MPLVSIRKHDHEHMIQLPQNLKRFLNDAQVYLKSGAILDVEFSGGTYQVLVEDYETKKREWAFLQLDGRGQLKDSFCSCLSEEADHDCVHQAAAFLYIYGNDGEPLHVRFQRSLWNCLCRHSAAVIGMQSEVLKKIQKGHYACRSVGGKVIFSIKGLTSEAIAQLESLIFDRKRETEETSLKFSNLPQEEILLWRQGKPTEALSYELSFWSDLAKLLMRWQKRGDVYKISFGYAANDLPNRIHIAFPEASMEFYLSEANLSKIVPALATVRSPLVVHSAPKEGIDKILYDKEKKSLVIVSKTAKGGVRRKPENVKGIAIPGWTYVLGDGFYSRNRHFLLSADELSGKDLEEALNEHAQTIRELSEGFVVHDTPVPVAYSISFDEHWTLHIAGYLFLPGDLSQGGSYCFGSWAYLPDDGFYQFQERYFENIETTIQAGEVSDFVTLHRSWFNKQEGFQTHISNLEAHLSYRLDKDDYLSFSRDLATEEMGTGGKDFGRWVYISGQGFFSKTTQQSGLSIQTRVAIPPDQIPIFIRVNRDELQLIRSFFSPQCPVVKCRLNIRLDQVERISIEPEYEFLPGYNSKSVRFFDDYVYVEGEGFHELPVPIRLPEPFRHPVVIDEDNLPLFIEYELPRLEPFIKEIDPRLRRPATIRLVADSVKHKNVGEDEGYALKLKYETEYGAVSASLLWHSLKQKKRFIFSDAGYMDLNERKFGWLKSLDKGRVDRRSNTVGLSMLELMRLNAYDEITLSQSKQYRESHDLLNDLFEFHTPEEPDLSGLQCSLRPYQQLGVHWLWFLYRHGLSGLLCDDMGLGKTHQAMALIAAVSNFYRKKETKAKLHFLVICPTSVIYHWQEKLSAFLPELKVWTFYGAKRSLESFYENCDILLTSYGVWRNEAELLADHPFEVAIFDEIQIAKNHMSHIHSALLKTKSKMRIGLSGTPFENHLRELKAVFDITLPTYMPGDSDYREFFVRPIEREGSRERKVLLSRLIKPFVIRRKKEDVLLDLPEKIEDIAHCDLMPSQRKLYIEALTASRDKIIEELEDEEKPIPYIHIFSLLSHLKQICNHPAAFLKCPKKYKEYQSGKWDLFIELLSEARESCQKVVVFSQYLYMLDIIEEHLNEIGVGYASIRGATMDRGEQLQRFKSDPRCEVFVGSLQAAGLGVDLTAASVVIHYDRWWNAARENQATDRVHRIGQTRGVQVFKLMTKETIEEHIDFLISKKGRLMEEIVGADDHQVLKKFDRKEIIKLLQIMPGS